MAINLTNLTANMPKANLEDYIVTLYGRPKVGKTSLFHAVVKRHYKGDLSKGLLIAFEKGYQALKGIYAADVAEWEDFSGMVNQLVTKRNELPFKLIAIDTVDQMYKMACEYVVKREKIKDKKAYKEIGDIPYGAGYQMVADEMYLQLERLQKIGLGIWFITHDKDKKFESRDGVSYDKTTVSLPTRARDVVINMSDFIWFIDNVKIQEDDRIRDERIIYLRADGTDIEAGSRFSMIREKVTYDADKLLQAFEEAVLSEVGDDVDINSLKEKQATEREEKAQEYVAAETAEEVTPASLIEALNEKVKELSAEDKKTVGAKFKAVLGGTANYTNTTDVDLLQQCLDFVNNLN